MRLLKFVCAGWLALFLFNPALGQRNPTSVISQGTAYYVFAQPGEATVEVIVLGSGPSGIYVVGTGIDLAELLALTGGGLRQSSPEVEVTTNVRLLREQGGQRIVVYESELQDMLRTPEGYPELLDGDVITVEYEQRRKFDLRTTLTLINTMASLTLLILRLSNAL